MESLIKGTYAWDFYTFVFSIRKTHTGPGRYSRFVENIFKVDFAETMAGVDPVDVE